MHHDHHHAITLAAQPPGHVSLIAAGIPVLTQDCRMIVAGARKRARHKRNNPNSILLRALGRMVARGHVSVHVVEVVQQMMHNDAGGDAGETQWEVTLGVRVEEQGLCDAGSSMQALVSSNGDFRIVMYALMGDAWMGGGGGGGVGGNSVGLDQDVFDDEKTTTSVIAAPEMRELLFSMMLPPVDAPLAEEPAGLLCTLFDYQRQALHWMLRCEGVVERDEDVGDHMEVFVDGSSPWQGDHMEGAAHNQLSNGVEKFTTALTTTAATALATHPPKSDAPHCLFEHLTLPSGERVWWNAYNGMGIGCWVGGCVDVSGVWMKYVRVLLVYVSNMCVSLPYVSSMCVFFWCMYQVRVCICVHAPDVCLWCMEQYVCYECTTCVCEFGVRMKYMRVVYVSNMYVCLVYG